MERPCATSMEKHKGVFAGKKGGTEVDNEYDTRCRELFKLWSMLGEIIAYGVIYNNDNKVHVRIENERCARTLRDADGTRQEINRSTLK